MWSLETQREIDARKEKKAMKEDEVRIILRSVDQKETKYCQSFFDGQLSFWNTVGTFHNLKLLEKHRIDLSDQQKQELAEVEEQLRVDQLGIVDGHSFMDRFKVTRITHVPRTEGNFVFGRDTVIGGQLEYECPNPSFKLVGRAFQNQHQVHVFTGLAWEWSAVCLYNTTLMVKENLNVDLCELFTAHVRSLADMRYSSHLKKVQELVAEEEGPRKNA